MKNELTISFVLRDEEARILRALALKECRHPREQVRYFLQCELERLGWLNPSPQQEGRNEQIEVAQ